MGFGHSLRSFFPALLTVAMLAVLLALGGWQVERLAWKEELLARMAERRTASPLTLASAADIAALQQAAHDFHPAVLKGRFGDKAVFWFTQIENKPNGLDRWDSAGYHMLVPFFLADGSAILLDRGFIPARLIDIPAPPPPQGGVSLAVILRWPDGRGAFDNDDDARAICFMCATRKPLARIGKLICRRFWVRRPWPMITGRAADKRVFPCPIIICNMR